MMNDEKESWKEKGGQARGTNQGVNCQQITGKSQVFFSFPLPKSAFPVVKTSFPVPKSAFPVVKTSGSQSKCMGN